MISPLLSRSVTLKIFTEIIEATSILPVNDALLCNINTGSFVNSTFAFNFFLIPAL